MTRQIQAAMQTSRGLSAQMLRYPGQRLQTHAENLQALAGCHMPQSVMEQQMASINNSARQMTQGAASLTDVAEAGSTRL